MHYGNWYWTGGNWTPQSDFKFDIKSVFRGKTYQVHSIDSLSFWLSIDIYFI